mgnify:CR=1 FL=1
MSDVAVRDVVRGVVIAVAGHGAWTVFQNQIIRHGGSVGHFQGRWPHGAIVPFADEDAHFVALTGIETGKYEPLRTSWGRAATGIREVTEQAQVAVTEMLSPVYLRFLGGIGGFVDAAGGGGWGPIVTPTLLATTKTEPRKVIGTVSAAEFIVAVAASVGFLANLYRLNVDWAVVGGLLIGGVIMAPVAAKLVSWLPKRKLGIAVATMIIVINALRLLGV